MAALALAMDGGGGRGTIKSKGQTIRCFELVMYLRQIVSLHAAWGCRAAKAHGGHYGERAGDAIVTAGSIVIEGSEGGFCNASHFVCDSFDEEYVIAAFVWNGSPLVGIQIVKMFGVAENMFVEDDAENSIVVTLEEMDDAEFVEE